MTKIFLILCGFSFIAGQNLEISSSSFVRQDARNYWWGHLMHSEDYIDELPISDSITKSQCYGNSCGEGYINEGTVTYSADQSDEGEFQIDLDFEHVRYKHGYLGSYSDIYFTSLTSVDYDMSGSMSMNSGGGDLRLIFKITDLLRLQL